MWRTVRAAVVLAILALPQAVLADPAKSLRPQDNANSFMRIYGPTLPPYGFVRFCESMPGECRQGPLEETRFNATPARMRQLDELNRYVNKVIEPATDMEIYGETERWAIPTTRGDCEDYALLKRKLLIERGWPASSLLMTVVRDEKGEGHAILTARVAQGDFILDNKHDDIRIWHKVRYSFVMRQSYIDPRVWVSLDPRDASTPAPVAGVRDDR